MYLGKGLTDAEGRFTLFPYWMDLLKKLYPDPLKPVNYNTLALTGCLTGDTEVPLLNGEVKTMKELSDIGDLDEYVYSYDVNTNEFVPGHLISAFSTGVKDVYEIELDNGEKFRATSNHKFMMRDKHWKSIDSGLSVGDSLMPVYQEYISFKSIVYVGKEEVYDLTVEQYHNFALKCGIVAHNSIGIGKTLVAVTIGLYELYRLMCLKDPYVFYGLQPIDKISLAFINITLDDARGVAWSKLQGLVQSSPWFLAHGDLSKQAQPEWSPKLSYRIELICGSLPRHFIGRALLFAFMDEVSFQVGQDIEKQITKAKALVNEASSRMKSRFMKGDVNPTIMVLASSKRTEQSFMETYIAQVKQHDDKTTLVIDEPQWIVRTDKNTDRKFKIAVGNKFLPSEVLPLDTTEEECMYYRERGFKLLDVPFSYYTEFIKDIDNALMTIAGISTTAISSYISGVRLSQCKVETIENPFVKDIIEVGDGVDDKAQYWDFFDLEKVDMSMMTKPLFMHLDMSLSGDKTGIAGVWIKGKNATTGELNYQLAFCVSVKAPRGHQVSFEKTRNFIYWLKDHGFKIKGITSDTYARSGVEQDLKAKGFNFEILSVDRCNQDRVCEPYAYFKNTIYEQRIMLPRRGINLLTEEIIGLKRDNNSGKVDHDASGINSKDSSDAVCGCIFNASRHAEEFAFDFGESAETMTAFNEVYDITEDPFEATLKEIMNGRFSKEDYSTFNISGPVDDILLRDTEGILII